MKKPKALYALSPEAAGKIYSCVERRDLAERVEFLTEDVLSADQILQHPELLAEVEVIFSGWGAPTLDADFLALAPHLNAFFYGAGSVKSFVTDAFWESGILLCSSWAMNAVPVMDYTIGSILLGAKRAWWAHGEVRRKRAYVALVDAPGTYRSRVGIVSLGEIGRGVCRKLQAFDVDVMAYDPFAPAELFTELKATTISLEELFRTCPVVSIHTPWLKETEGLITGELIASLQPGATLINTSRGAVVDEPAMIEVLKARPDIQAVLDVTFPEPPEASSPLYDLPNVFLTPHIAGSMGPECARMGRCMIDEFDRYMAGEAQQCALTKAKVEKLA